MMREVEGELEIGGAQKPREGVCFKKHGIVSLNEMHSKGYHVLRILLSL